MSVLRSLKRSVANHRMDIAGYVHVNKRGHHGDKSVPSFFSTHWREYLVKTAQK